MYKGLHVKTSYDFFLACVHSACERAQNGCAMIEKLWKSIQEASGALLEQADQLGKGAREKAFQLIEDWLKVFPRLEAAGLQMTSFAMGIALNPSLDVEFRGHHADFSIDRLEALLEEHRDSTALSSVFKTIKTTYRMHQQLDSPLQDPLILKIKIRLSPEIKVYLGEPLIE